MLRGKNGGRVMKAISTAIAGAAICAALAGPAQALNSRTWISGTGTDNPGCGVIATPCRTLQFAHDNTAAGGEIDIKDSAGYGAVTIGKAITILANGTIGGSLAGAGANAITVSAGANDAIVLQGLAIEGAGVALNGIVFNSGRSLTVINCTIQNFAGNGATGNGIIVQAPGPGASLITIADTTLVGNAGAAIRLAPPSGTASTVIVVSHVLAVRNPIGISVDTTAATSGAVQLDVSGFTAAFGTNGILIPTGPVSQLVRLDAITLYNQSGVGLSASGSTTNVSVGRSVITDNFIGVQIAGSATVSTYGDNRISFNTTDVSGTMVGVAPR
jgi:hypothetical protein